MQEPHQPTLGDVYGATASLLQVIKAIGDATLVDLGREVGRKVAALSVESQPSDVRAVVEMVDVLDAALRRLADDINTIEAAQDAVA